ncbi:PEP5 protein [Colletotrichum orchidophilum]|uniref:PEP5 protein n=1 Tax=Colletotrichum orchidophilum TaxID=1209926 RepID=A0A1G4BRD3_9PEZI|nr:PEP5 protein [Colletotrichum orchidophilum]OHF03928.1 PEP5 protein [Colletotrichum orchidophilum]
MFHHGLFTGNRNFSISLFCVFAEGMAFFAANTYFAFQVSVLYETDAIIVGARYSLMLVAAGTGAAIAGWYCAITKRVRWITVLAFLIFVAFFACMATTNRDTSNPVWGYPILLGIALGMTLPTLVTAAQLSIPPELISVASGLIISVRSLGGTIGITIYSVLFNDGMSLMAPNIAKAVLPAGLDADNLPAIIGALISHNESAIAQVPDITPDIVLRGTHALLDTYVEAFRDVWISAACFVAVAAIVSAFLFDPEKEFNNHIDAPLEEKHRFLAAE